MTLDDYNNLSRLQKLAVFLTLIGPESAARILGHFEDFEIEQIGLEMTNIELVDEAVQQRAFEEFAEVIGESINSVAGGYDVARETLELLKGPYQAERFVAKLSPTRNSSEVIKELSEMEPRQIYNVIRTEQPQMIAFLLSYLSPRKASQIVELCPSELRTEITLRMGTLEATSASTINTVVRRLERHLDSKGPQSLHKIGGSNHLADVLNLLDRSISKPLLERIEEQNAALGANVRKRMFTFDDLIRLSVTDLQRLLREVDAANLALALKPVSQALKDKIMQCMSKRAAEALQEELEFMGAVKLKEVEAAQEAIITIVRRLEEEGEISLDQEGQEYV